MLSSYKSCIIRGTLSSTVSVNECLILLWYVNTAQIFCQRKRAVTQELATQVCGEVRKDVLQGMKQVALAAFLWCYLQ